MIETSKRLAAYTAVDQHVKPEHTVGCLSCPYNLTVDQVIKIIGIGSGGRDQCYIHVLLQLTIGIPGSTVPYVVERIMQQGEVNKDRVFIPTGRSPELRTSLTGAIVFQDFSPKN